MQKLINNEIKEFKNIFADKKLSISLFLLLNIIQIDLGSHKEAIMNGLLTTRGLL